MATWEDSGTLSASTVLTITLPATEGQVTLVARDGAAEIWGTSDGSTPVVGGSGVLAEFYLPASKGSFVQFTPETTTIKLISSGTPEFEVGLI